MGKNIMILCPSTGKPLHTGFMADDASFANCDYSNNSSSCPHCGQMHVWDKKDAFLEVQTPPKSGAKP